MKIYRNISWTALIVVLMATFCYGSEIEVKKSPESGLSATKHASSVPSSPSQKIVPMLNLSLSQQWEKTTSTLKTQLTTLINNPQNKISIIDFEKNINIMIPIVKEYAPENKKVGTLNFLLSMLNDIKNNKIKDPTNQIARLDNLQKNIASLISIELKKEPTEQTVALSRKRKAIPQQKEQDDKSFSKEIYDLEIKIQKLLTSLIAAIKEGSPIFLYKNYLAQMQDSMGQLLENKLESLISQPALPEKETNQISFAIQIVQTLQDFHRIELDMAEGKKEEIDKDDANTFVDNFIELAQFIKNTTFDLNDKKLIKYVMNSSLFKDYFITKNNVFFPNEKIVMLVPEDKKEDFQKAYKIIKDKLNPTIATKSEERIVEPSNQPEVQNPPVIVVPSEPKIEQPLTQIKPNEEAMKQAVAIREAQKKQQPDQPEKPAETNPEKQSLLDQQTEPDQKKQAPLTEMEKEPKYDMLKPFELLGQGIGKIVTWVTSAVGVVWNWITSKFSAQKPSAQEISPKSDTQNEQDANSTKKSDTKSEESGAQPESYSRLQLLKELETQNELKKQLAEKEEEIERIKTKNTNLNPRLENLLRNLSALSEK